jgi:hypothetical protein
LHYTYIILVIYFKCYKVDFYLTLGCITSSFDEIND